jgi:hypothetical protein
MLNISVKRKAMDHLCLTLTYKDIQIRGEIFTRAPIQIISSPGHTEETHERSMTCMCQQILQNSCCF